MKEVITVHIGECGLNLGKAMWKRFSEEHGITNWDKNEINVQEANPIFHEGKSGCFGARAIFIDGDNDVMSNVANDKHMRRVSPVQTAFITSKEDSSHLFTKASYNYSSIRETVDDQLRLQLERCDQAQALVFVHSLDGGSGSGTTEAFLNRLPYMDDAGKLPRISFAALPTRRFSMCIPEPYNTTNSFSNLQEHTSAVVCFDNEAICDMAETYFNVPDPRYKHMNELIAYCYSAFLANTRFGGPLQLTIQDWLQQLVPNAKIPFIAPTMMSFANAKLTLPEKLIQLGKSHMVRNMNLNAPVLASVCSYMGNDINMAQLLQAKQALDKSMTFHDSNKHQTLLSMCQLPAMDKCAMGSSFAVQWNNHLGFEQVLQRTSKRFETLYEKRSHCFSFVGYMAKSDFSYVRYVMDECIQEYKSLCQQ